MVPVVAVAAAIIAGSWAVPAIAVLAGAVFLGVILCRLDVAVAVLDATKALASRRDSRPLRWSLCALKIGAAWSTSP